MLKRYLVVIALFSGFNVAWGFVFQETVSDMVKWECGGLAALFTMFLEEKWGRP